MSFLGLTLFSFLGCLEVVVLWLETKPAVAEVGAVAKLDQKKVNPWPELRPAIGVFCSFGKLCVT